MGAEADEADHRFESTYRRCWSPVFRLALAWTNDWGAAEELAQEAFTRLWVHRDRINWDDDPLAWLLVVTRRLATDRFRRLRRTLAPHPPRALAFEMDDRAQWLDLREAFARLSPVERAAIVMTAVIGHSYEEAAGILGTTPGAMRAAVSRGRAKLGQMR
jgi:RNA polymerase sigma-70 factor (ECF subfamily)